MTEPAQIKHHAVVLAGYHAGKVVIEDEITPTLQLPVIPIYTLQDFKEGKPLDTTPIELKNYVLVGLMNKAYYIPEEWTASNPQLTIANYIEELIKAQAQ